MYYGIKFENLSAFICKSLNEQYLLDNGYSVDSMKNILVSIHQYFNLHSDISAGSLYGTTHKNDYVIFRDLNANPEEAAHYRFTGNFNMVIRSIYNELAYLK